MIIRSLQYAVAALRTADCYGGFQHAAAGVPLDPERPRGRARVASTRLWSCSGAIRS